jgi:hypothetical protein
VNAGADALRVGEIPGDTLGSPRDSARQWVTSKRAEVWALGSTRVSRIQRLACAGLVFGVVTLATAMPAHAEGVWIAVAVSQSSGEAAAQTGNTAVNAAGAATGDCNRIGHVYDCQLVAFGQGGCVATATPGTPHTIKAAWAASREAASSAALAKAAPGSRVVAFCIGDPGLPG